MASKFYSFQLILSVFMVLILSSCSKDVDYTPPAGTTEMVITHYSYDKLVIDGENHAIDLMIMPNGKITSWSFDRDTHRITPNDLQDHIIEDVKTIIIGSGYHGDGFLDDEALTLIKKLEVKGISVHFLPTSQAVNLFTFLHIRN